MRDSGFEIANQQSEEDKSNFQVKISKGFPESWRIIEH
jgi:hypothetical protein